MPCALTQDLYMHDVYYQQSHGTAEAKHYRHVPGNLFAVSEREQLSDIL
jgi:hypothetical protein